jgi:hypothetical protein
MTLSRMSFRPIINSRMTLRRMTLVRIILVRKMLRIMTFKSGTGHNKLCRKVLTRMTFNRTALMRMTTECRENDIEPNVIQSYYKQQNGTEESDTCYNKTM